MPISSNIVWTRNDRDLLVSLNTKFDLFSAQITDEVQELKNGIKSQIVDHQKRIVALETIVTQTNLLQSYYEFRELQQEVRDYKIGLKVAVKQWIIIAGILQALFLTLITQIPNILALFNFG